MLIKNPDEIKGPAITPEDIYLNRRKFLKYSAFSIAGSLIPASELFANPDREKYADLKAVKSKYSTTEEKNSWEHITTYNNFYEFGTGKNDPSENAQSFKTKPWTIKIDGECNKPAEYHVDDLIRNNQLEDRVYRLRCVEAWSMVVPWVGIPLSIILNKAEPNSKAKYVEFTTLYDPSRMPGQNYLVLEWPYVEGLRMDEAMNPLTILAVGIYGKVLPNQNGAPARLVVPWKYGFKSIKSIVRIRFSETMPRTSWNIAAPREYGFYANVNPEVDHPRWSQGSERRLGNFFRQKTVMFNGYADQVAHMYGKMDLRKWF